MYNKRGQGLSTNAIILIILGVIVLAVLIIGFTIGWRNIAPWVSTDNVDTIIKQCATACSTDSVYDFCSKPRELKEGGLRVQTSCMVFSNTDVLKNRYNVEPCPGISCTVDCENTALEQTFKREIINMGVGLGEEDCDPGYEITPLSTEAGKCCISETFDF